MSKTKITPKNKRDEKAPSQIQIPSLGPKPDISCMKQIGQRERRESWKIPSLEEVSLMMMAWLKMDEI